MIQAVAALIAAGAAIGSAIIGAVAKGASEEQARKLLAQARDEFGNINLPKLEELSAAALPPTELAKIKSDPRLMQAQYNALDKLGEIGDSQGLTLQDQALLEASMGKVSRAESAGRGAIRENMAARGTLGSGAELAMSLDNQQDAANSARTVGMDVAGRAQERALDAIMKRGQLGGQMRDQDWREKSRVAEAQDIINRYNGTRNNGLRQQMFDNQMRKTHAMNGTTGALADSYRREGDQAARTAGGVGLAIGQGAAAVGGYANAQPQAPAQRSVWDDDYPFTPAEKLDYE